MFSSAKVVLLWNLEFIVCHNNDTFDNGCEAVPPQGCQ